MKANRQPKARADLSTLGTMLRPKAVASVEEAENAIAKIMDELEPFQRQLLAHRILRRQNEAKP